MSPMPTGTQAQLALPFDLPPRVRHGRAVIARPEDGMLHEAVIALRRLGHQVYRAGADHKVDGRLLSTSQLLAVAHDQTERHVPIARRSSGPRRASKK